MKPAMTCCRRNLRPWRARSRRICQAVASAAVGARRRRLASSSLFASMSARRVTRGGREGWLMIDHRHEGVAGCVADAIFLAGETLVVRKTETMAAKDGVLPFTIEVVDDDASLTAHAGLPMVLETMRALGLSDDLNRTLGIRRRHSGATDAQKV